MESINTGLHMCDLKQLESAFGKFKNLTDDCGPVTLPALKKRMVTKSVGPFRVTGLDVAVELLRRTLQDVAHKHPELYRILGSAGMTCVRRIRGSKSSPSNHSYGCAVDITIGGQLDTMGDNLVYRGLLQLYSVMKLHGWFWGAGFSREDAMHFEVSAEKLKELLALKGEALRKYLNGE